MVDREKYTEIQKFRKTKYRNTKIWISAERKKPFVWNKRNFADLFKVYHLVKKRKIANTSFNLSHFPESIILEKLRNKAHFLKCSKFNTDSKNAGEISLKILKKKVTDK